MTAVKSFKSRLVVAVTLAFIGVLALVSFFALHIFRNPSDFIVSHAVLFGSLAVTFVLGGLWSIKKGLNEFNQLRANLSDVREGRSHRIEGLYPTEVQPLVDDLNALLEHRDKAIARAVAKAGDLAHGLKTPLAVLSREADRAKAAGEHELAETITEQVGRMQRQVDYHLAHARAAASGATAGASCSVADSAEGLIRALRRLHADRGLTIESQVAAGHIARAQREDLDEMLGNLLDNACKWARSRVFISSTVEGPNILIHVDDDGPGLDPAKRDLVLKRGVRADEAAPGSGLGLAIVRDLAELYGGTIHLNDSAMGGLRAQLSLPR